MAGTSNRRTGQGRKSPGAAAVIARGPGMQHPQPPDVFSKAERAHWNRIAGAMPPDWFTSECRHLLERLCVLLAWSERMEAELRASGHYRFADRKDNIAYLDTLKQIVSLTTRLRLSPQSRYNRHEAGSRMRNRTRYRPWEEDGNGDDGPKLRIVDE